MSVVEAIHIAVEEAAPCELAPGESRRQVMTRGVDVNALVGRRFRVGEVARSPSRTGSRTSAPASLRRRGKGLLRVQEGPGFRP